MDGLFSTVLRMSLTAGLVILAVLAARAVLRLAGAPRKYAYVLWAVALFRLLCPLAPEGPVSPLPAPEAAAALVEGWADDYVGTTATFFDNTPEFQAAVEAGLPVQSGGYVVTAPDGVSPPATAGEVLFPWLTSAWAAGAAVLLLRGAISHRRLRRRLVGAVRMEGNVYQADHISTPFVMGLFKPRIYLPSGLGEGERGYILRHERTHIRRLDHLWKLLAFLALALHWFNPLVWLAFTLAGRDMEASCDEAVLRRTAGDIRAEYAQSILRLAAGRPSPATPLAFGAGDAKDRIRTVLRWKKPARWMTALGAAAAALVIGALAVNPASGDPMGHSYRTAEMLYADQRYSFSYTEDTAPQYSVTGTGELLSRAPSEDEWTYLGELTEISWSRGRRYALFDALTGRARAVMDQVARMWRLDTFDQNGTLYLLMETRRGAALLGVGYDRPEGESVRWLFRLRAAGQPAEVPAGAGAWTASGSFAYVLQPGEQAVSERPVVLTEEAPDFCYQTTWSLGSMAVQVGLAAEDGTEYLPEFAGGSARGMFRNLPPGSYRVVVRSSTRNLRYAETTTVPLEVTGAIAFTARDA